MFAIFLRINSIEKTTTTKCKIGLGFFTWLNNINFHPFWQLEEKMRTTCLSPSMVKRTKKYVHLNSNIKYSNFST
jgi:hypothetical protein